ncbi:hypothetical protein Avbf_13502 [Armadillidium vulgare]|nr:hypothetical protein Avbf_13502 [Armadillidium vulgare]
MQITDTIKTTLHLQHICTSSKMLQVPRSRRLYILEVLRSNVTKLSKGAIATDYLCGGRVYDVEKPSIKDGCFEGTDDPAARTHRTVIYFSHTKYYERILCIFNIKKITQIYQLKTKLKFSFFECLIATN